MNTMDSQNLTDAIRESESGRKTSVRNWYVYFCGFTANLLVISWGFAFSWPSSVIPKLQSTNQEVNPFSTPISTIQISTLAALPTAAALVGLIIAPIMSNTLGRKKTLTNLSVVLVISFTILSFAKQIYVYFVCIFVNGICESVLGSTVPVYNTEIADKKNRGKIGCLFGMSVPLGNLLCYFSGTASMSTICLVGTICPGIFLLLSFFLPESPVFLASKGMQKQCLKSLETLRGTNNVDLEYEQIQEMLKYSIKTKTSVFDIFKYRSSLKAFLLSLELFGVQQATGIFILGVFMAPIFNEAGSYLSGNSLGVVTALVQVIVVLLVYIFVDKLGRKPFLLTSCICCVFNLFILGVYFYLKHIKSAYIADFRWLPILCVVLYFIGYSIGMGPIPFATMTELFPNDLRAVGVATVLFIANISIFATLFSFPLITEQIGVHYTLWINSFLTIIGCLLIYFTVPETNEKSLLEIQSILNGVEDINSITTRLNKKNRII